MALQWTNENEQWKLAGMCSICRRKNYCSKPCKANKISTERRIKEGVINAIIKPFLVEEDDHLNKIHKEGAEE